MLYSARGIVECLVRLKNQSAGIELSHQLFPGGADDSFLHPRCFRDSLLRSTPDVLQRIYFLIFRHRHVFLFPFRAIRVELLATFLFNSSLITSILWSHLGTRLQVSHLGPLQHAENNNFHSENPMPRE
jgi:hypothetical protein